MTEEMEMSEEVIKQLLIRKEVFGQQIQRRCFVTSSFRNRDLVHSSVTYLRDHGWFVYDFTVAQFSVSEDDWDGMSYYQARLNPEILGAAVSDLTMLRCLGALDVILVVLPAGFSAGWETGFAAARGARVVVCGDISSQMDLPLLHADKIFETVEDALVYLRDLVQAQ
jgi:hypothetical protein